MFHSLGILQQMKDISLPPPNGRTLPWQHLMGCLTSSLIVFRLSSTVNVNYTCVIEKLVVKFVDLENFLIIKATRDLCKLKEGSQMQKV